MKITSLFTFVFLLFISLSGCKHTTEKSQSNKEQLVIENVTKFKDELELNQLEGTWYYKNSPYDGYSLVLHENGQLAEKVGFIDGKRQGVAQRFSTTGALRVEYHYKDNRLEGSYKTWWKNGQLAQEASYVNGKIHGVEKKWYTDGQLAKERQLVNGKEEGLQKAWLQNGTLYVNYEAKNGRIFGLRRANSCYQLEDETVVRSENEAL
ncbi:toxin-antitoxin system YwqK family antitoxin [Maribacter sp. SA7]|uniref:toxin-antitoxin system YwqK family antitoxin n=1 Tax=Maribacter zhoushanensis TaxID=3030012 RepID=UPI0023EE0BD6|nr:toxin-antitoxin system YwqK family antitoxin [Maribacter zhoushanensis]MDF4203007.1 toxin-antitoxin system YwqK family antitoxin [Maribacter zhoushanensis]